MPVDPMTRLGELSVGQRQRVEIVKVLYRGARILIMDEPTAVLVPQEIEELLRNLRGLRDEGFTILFISHKLDEVLAVADVITVMRAGTTVATVLPSETDPRRLAELMVGSELPEPARHGVPPRSAVALSVRGVTIARPGVQESLHDLSLTVREGEIVGLAGVEGNGQAELIEVILGLAHPTAGSIELAGRDVTALNTRERRAMGLAYIPQDRQREGLLLDAPLWENRMIGHQMLPPVTRGPWIDRKHARADTERIVRESDVRTPSIDVAVSALSGGNQQKLIVGRELSGEPRLLIAAHPTRGVDVGAQAGIWGRLVAARDAGLAVLLVSADLQELIGLSDRIAVILRGAITGEFDPRTVTPQALGAAMTGVAGMSGVA
jgi:simple sugar transport system ATP-binding protein